MKIKSIWMITGLLSILALSACAAPATVSSNAGSANIRQLTASGTGEVYLTPDVAYVNIGIHTQSENVADALNDNNAQAQAIATALKELGVEEKDIQTSAFNVYPSPQYSPVTGEVTSTLYAVDNTVYVTVRDLQSLGKMLDEVVRSGANNINGIQFDVIDQSAALTEARQKAIASAKATAQELAQAAGVQLGDLQTLSVYPTSNASPVYEKGFGGATANSQVSVACGQLVITVNADVTYQSK